MRPFFARLVLAALLAFQSFPVRSGDDPFGWEAMQAQSYPGAFWWWPGSAVNREELDRNISELAEVGIKTLRLDAIYSGKDSNVPTLDYLSDDWNDAVKTALEIAGERGVTLDLWGNGWPFGGPWISDEHASRRLEWDDVRADVVFDTTETLVQDEGYPILQVIVTAPGAATGEATVIPQETLDGKPCWRVPPGRWDLYVFRNGFTKMAVKRASPGGEGPVVDHFSEEALEDYLEPIDRLMDSLGEYRFGRVHYDSYEVYGANWTGEFLGFFRDRRGYGLAPYLPALISEATSVLASRIRHDYRQTLEEIHVESFMKPWIRWAHERGLGTSYQAHGSPGHLIDLYGLADQPDTEAFGRVGMRTDGAGAEGGGHLCSKFASSAAHLNGRRFTSSETFTWLDDHFCVSLDRMRKDLDYFFLAGVNRMYFHSTTYSASDVPFPGWLYYAGTNVDSCQPWWKHLPHFNESVARVQTVLQAGGPGEDVLLLYPIHDLWFDNEGSGNLLQYCQVHNTQNWLHRVGKPAAETARAFWRRGWMFDWVSDRVVSERIRVEDGDIVCGDGRYKALVIPECDWVSRETLESVRDVAERGGSVVFVGSVPQAVPTGPPSRDVERLSLEQRKSEIGSTEKGIVFVNAIADLDDALHRSGARREPMADSGLRTIRRLDAVGISYFVKNENSAPYDGWLPLGVSRKSVVAGDPVTGKIGKLATRAGKSGPECRLRIPPEGTVLLRATDREHELPPFETRRDDESRTIPILGPWNLSWTDSGAKKFQLETLESWTEIPDLRFFSGTVAYETSFDVPGEFTKLAWKLELGDPKESADVFLNGKSVGCVWTSPYELEIDSDVFLPGKNALRIEVTNLLANRIIALEKTGVHLKDRHLFVNYAYRPFDAEDWTPLPSGLPGPVRFIAAR